MLSNPSLAKENGVTGLLNISSSTRGVLHASVGQTLKIPITLKLTSFDSTLTSVTVSFDTVQGQESIGSFDITGAETYSQASVNLGAGKTLTTVLSLTVPSGVQSTTFKLFAGGLSVSPSAGLFILYDTDITVAIS
ncbi:MAG: hypothetical protein HY247_04360 [archaeon]|nr:MAG: hypothetical protein HY247_04360 [archaeon]